MTLDLVRGDTDIGYMKGVLLMLNLLVTFVGIELISLGIYDLTLGYIPQATYLVPGFMLIIGSLILIFSVHGHVSALLESKSQLRVYFMVLMILSLVQLIAFGTLVYGRSRVGSSVEHFWKTNYEEYPTAIRNLEEEFECCGLHNTMDYAFPKAEKDTCLKSPYFGYLVPCYNLVKRAVSHEMNLLITWSVIALVIQLVTALYCYATYKRISDTGERERLLS